MQSKLSLRRALTIFAFPALAACDNVAGFSVSAVQAARAANAARDAAIWEARQTVTVAGQPFGIGVSPDRSFALVGPQVGASFTYRAVHAAAAAVTGCTVEVGPATFLPGDTVDTVNRYDSLRYVNGRIRVPLIC